MLSERVVADHPLRCIFRTHPPGTPKFGAGIALSAMWAPNFGVVRGSG